MELILLFSFYLIFVYKFMQKAQMHEGIINPVLVFSIFHFVYYWGIPLESYVTNNYVISAEIFDYPTSLTIGYLSLTSYIGFYLGYLLAMPKKLVVTRLLYSKKDGSRLNYVQKNMQYVLIVLIAAFAILFRSEIIASASYEGNIETSYSSPTYKYLIQFITFIIIIYALVLYHSGKPKFAIFAALLPLVWGIYSNDKNPIVLSLIVVLLVLVNKRRLRSNASFILFSVILVLTPILSVAFSLFRAGAALSFDSSLGVFKRTDAKGPFISILEILKSSPDLELGLTYLKAWILWVPKSVWEDRPLDLSSQFAQSYMTDWQIGYGLGYSPLAEGLLNFWHLGPFIYFFILSVALFKLRNYIAINKPGYHWVFTVFLFNYFILMHRSPFSLPADMLRFLVPLFIVNVLTFKRYKLQP